MAFVFAVIGAAFVLFAIERFRVDQVALAIPVVLLVAGILSPDEAISGFSNQATVTVAAMLVLSLGLVKTGAVDAIARWARRAEMGGPRRRVFVLCAIAAAISPFLNNTPVVVVFLPVFLAVAQAHDEPPSLYLIPLSFAAILGGTVTLIGTSTNLIVYGVAREHGLESLSMFSIAPLGLLFLGVGFAYLFTVGRALMPRRTGEPDVTGKYEVRTYVAEIRVPAGAPVVGRELESLNWKGEYGTEVLGVRAPDRSGWTSAPETRVEAGDTLVVQGHHEDLLWLVIKEDLENPVTGPAGGLAEDEGRQLAEVLVGPSAPVIGSTLREARFRRRYNVTVLALQTLVKHSRTPPSEARLEAGDLLLVFGAPRALEALVDEPGFVPVSAIQTPFRARPRALVAVGILAAVVLVAGVGLMPVLPAALIGVTLMLFTRCVRLEEAYEDLDWMVILLLAGVIPLGTAMEKTGAAAWLASHVSSAVGPYGPVAVVAAFYLLTSLLTNAMSNNATAVVLTPIAILSAVELDMNPTALLVAVMFGASASFMTPIGYQTNTLVYGPGGYRFADFLRVGAPLNLLLLAVAAFFIPVLWPS